VFFDTGTPSTGDFKFDLSGPASPTAVRLVRYDMGPSAAVETAVQETSYTSATAILGAGQGGRLKIEMIVQNGSTAGTLALRWAQNSSNANATTVLAGSSVKYLKF
jgi:hypothetical protein